MTIETDRLISPVGNTEDRVIDKAIRPKRLADYVGQPRTREQMEIFISAAKLRHEALDHLLIFGPPGLGKCITANSTILTDSGWIQMSSLIPDNMADDTYHELSIPIYGLEGIENTSHIYSNGIQDTIRITTRAGFSIEGTVNHPVWAEGSIWKCLGELTLQDKVGIAINMSIKEPHDLRAMFSNDKIFTSSCDYMRTQIQLDLCIFGVIAQRKEDNLFLEEEIKDSTTYWDYIDKIEYGRAPVYDFCVPGTHSFVANGFYNHNTTLANIIASEMDVNIRQTSGPVLERAGDLAAILTNLEKNDVLFIDEIHRLSPVVEEILYPAMEDFQLDIMIGEGPAARSIKLDLPPFTLVGATTRAGLLTSPLRDRFGITQRLEFYNHEDLAHIITRSADIMNVTIDKQGAIELARRSRGTPRIANRLLRRVRDYAQVRSNGIITQEVTQKALILLNVDAYGLDVMDSKVLLAIMEKFEGGPVGIENLAAVVGEERGTIEDVIEPFLLQQGFLMRTSRGRVVTRLAWQHFGLTPDNDLELFTMKD